MTTQEPGKDPLMRSTSTLAIAANALALFDNESTLVWPVVSVASLSTRHREKTSPGSATSRVEIRRCKCASAQCMVSRIDGRKCE